MTHVWMIGYHRSGYKDGSVSVVVGGGGGGLVLWGGGAGIVGMTLFHCSVSLVFVCSGGIDVHRGCFL